MNNKPVEDLVTEIAEKSGKTEKEICSLIKEKVQKFSGLLTEQGAAFMVGKTLGYETSVKESPLIRSLKEGMKGVDVRGNVQAIFPPKEFNKNGKIGKLRSIIIGDESGEIRLTLWNDQADNFDLTIGSEVAISNGIVSTYNDRTQLSLGFNGKLTVLNKAEKKFEKLSDLKAGLNNVNVVGKLLRKFPVKEFDSKGRKGKLCNFQFGDETALLRATAWNDKAEVIENYNEGAVLELVNGYTKDGLFGVEFNLGYSAEIRPSEKELPSIKEILKESIPEKQVNELVDSENVILKGKVFEVTSGKMYYLVCEKCGKKASKMGDSFVCDSCGETKPEKRAIISIVLEDETGKIGTNFFGNTALKALGLTQEQLEKELDSKEGETIANELTEKLKGKEIELYGYTKENSFSGEREFTVKELL